VVLLAPSSGLAAEQAATSMNELNPSASSEQEKTKQRLQKFKRTCASNELYFFNAYKNEK